MKLFKCLALFAANAQACIPPLLFMGTTEACIPPLLFADTAEACIPPLLFADTAEACIPPLLFADTAEACIPPLLFAANTEACIPLRSDIDGRNQEKSFFLENYRLNPSQAILFFLHINTVYVGFRQ